MPKSVPSCRHVKSKRAKKKSQQQSISGIVSIERGGHFKRKGTKLCTMDVSLLGRLKDNVGSGGAAEW